MQQTKSKHIIQRRQQAGTLKQQVQKLLNWSDEQHFDFVHDIGLSFLLHHLQGAVSIDEHARSKIFWNWFKNQWAERDRQFLNDLGTQAGAIPVCRLVKYYMLKHDPQLLAQGRGPNAIVMADGFAKMHQDIIDNEIHVK